MTSHFSEERLNLDDTPNTDKPVRGNPASGTNQIVGFEEINYFGVINKEDELSFVVRINTSLKSTKIGRGPSKLPALISRLHFFLHPCVRTDMIVTPHFSMPMVTASFQPRICSTDGK